MAHTPAPLMLSAACELGDGKLVETLLAAQPDLALALDGRDRRKIAAAARNNDTATVRLMLEAGWPVDARGQHGGTPLHWAAWHGNAEMTRELLRRGAPLDLKDTDHDGTPIGWAVYGSVHGWNCRTGDYGGTVDALLRAGATPPSLDEKSDASDAVRQVLRTHGERPRP
jgi:ankyrin repeat protein